MLNWTASKPDIERLIRSKGPANWRAFRYGARSNLAELRLGGIGARAYMVVTESPTP
jgi:hypothetical protein